MKPTLFLMALLMGSAMAPVVHGMETVIGKRLGNKTIEEIQDKYIKSAKDMKDLIFPKNLGEATYIKILNEDYMNSLPDGFRDVALQATRDAIRVMNKAIYYDDGGSMTIGYEKARDQLKEQQMEIERLMRIPHEEVEEEIFEPIVRPVIRNEEVMEVIPNEEVQIEQVEPVPVHQIDEEEKSEEPQAQGPQEQKDPFTYIKMFTPSKFNRRF